MRDKSHFLAYGHGYHAQGSQKTNRQKLLQRALWAILAKLLLVGCSAPSDEEVTVTFAGEICTTSGPSEMQSGENQFILKSLTEDNHSFQVYRLRDGYTYQDVVDTFHGNEVASSGAAIPDWLAPASYAGYEQDESTGEETFTFHLKQEGDFAPLICAQDSTSAWRRWGCGPLKAVLAPTE